MHYLNNASTTWPKPEIVYQTMDQSFRHMFSPKRGTSSASVAGDALLNQARDALAQLLNIPDSSQVYFTLGGTHGLNLAIQGYPWEKGDGIVMSAIEHHAVSRPIRKMAREKGIEFYTVPYSDDEPFDLKAYKQLLDTHNNIKMIATVHASNVIGCILPVQEIGRIAREHGIPYLVDAAQTAGALPIDVEAMNIDILAVPGHKSLYGPPGIGAIYINDSVQLNTFMEGGTGGDSGVHPMSPGSAAYFEVGTIPMVLIQTLASSVNWLLEKGVDNIRQSETEMLTTLLDGLKQLPDVTVYGHTNIDNKSPLVSFNVAGRAPKDVGKSLHDEYGIALRAGFHCAPMAHEALGTINTGGTVRASIGSFTSHDDIEALLTALKQITQSN